MWISVHLVKGFQTGMFGCVLNYKEKRGKKVFIFIHTIHSFTYRKGISGYVAKQLQLFVAFFEHITK